jgi:UDP-2,4-diacetamido-2,4,6-trideoxy-beta-L-altropyranose hydrolase
VADPESTDMTLRLAELQDSAFLWQWRNDPEARNNSLDPQPIGWGTHLEWYAKQLSDPRSRIFILTHVIEGPQAQARYHGGDSAIAEVHLTVAPLARGRGLGTRLLQQSAPMALDALAVEAIRATILRGNRRSVRAFERAGYRLAGASSLGSGRCVIYWYCGAQARGR